MLISVSERFRNGDGSFGVRVGFEGGGDYDAVVTNPVGDREEALLGWWFEEHLRFPFLDRDRVGEAAGALAGCGTALFGQVFGGAAAGEYRVWAGRSFDGCRLQVSGSAAFHRLHWETLRDPSIPDPLAVRLPVTRRVDGVGMRFEVPRPGDTLNILVVTSRPDGARDVGYRTISRPLLAGLRRADRPVRVDLVRPGTWEAFRDWLRAATSKDGSGFYQVVHFDLHGALADYQALERGRASQRYLFGDGGPGQFEGQRGFLFFETKDVGKACPVAAGQVAALLAEHRVPVAVLNACQSAKESASEASLAQQLVEAGVPVAVGMAYSVTVTAAEMAMPVLYAGLAGGADLVMASHTARRALFDDRSRQAYFDQQIDLDDWVLPVTFAQRALTLELAEMTPAREVAFYAGEARVGEEPGTEYGFVGRDLDIHALERAVLLGPAENLALVQGLAGAGKSTLLRHLAWWWQRTHLVEDAFVFSYEDRAWTAAQIAREIAVRLLDGVGLARLDAMPFDAQLEKVAGLLRARRYLLVLDNLESVTASPAAIPHALTQVERQRLAGFLGRLRGGASLVLFGSREAEGWLAAGTFVRNVYRLPGLDEQAASVLVDRILTQHGGTRHLSDGTQREALKELTTLLGGYPLALSVVLPALATRTPSEVLADLREGQAGADPVGLISRAIEYSHGKLDPATQNSLLLLAPFTAAIPAGFLAAYAEALADLEPVAGLGPIDLDAAVAEAVRVGLAAPHPVLPQWVQVLPVLPYFLRTRLHDQPDLSAATRQAHYQLYTGLGPAIDQLLTSNDPQQRQAGHAAARTDYANLNTAVDHALTTRQPVLPVLAAVDEYLDQTKQQPARRQLLDHAIAAPRPDLRQELAHLHHRAGRLAQDQGRFTEAEENYRQALALFLEFNDRHSVARTYHGLGVVAQDQGRFTEAEDNYRQALILYLEFNDRYSAAFTYHQFGMVARKQRRFSEAEDNLRQALTLKLEFNDRHSAALTYGELGIVAREQRRFTEAEDNYRQALALYLEFNDRHSAASTYHNLGRVAREQRWFAEAEENYRQALALFLEFNDRHSAAFTYHELGIVASEKRRFTEAEDNLRQALALFLEFNDRHSAARTYGELGIVALEQRRFAEAEENFRQASALFLEFNNRHSVARTYHNLGIVALEQRWFAEAEENFRQALALFLEFNDRHSVAGTYQALGIVALEQRRFAEAVSAWLDAAVAWHDSTGAWPQETLILIKQARATLDWDQLAQILASTVPAPLRQDITTAIDETPDSDQP